MYNIVFNTFYVQAQHKFQKLLYWLDKIKKILLSEIENAMLKE